MPWRQTSPMDQRTQFIADHLRDALTVTELCELYGVSRKTGYKWIDRYRRLGPAGLEERSRHPHPQPPRNREPSGRRSVSRSAAVNYSRKQKPRASMPRAGVDFLREVSSAPAGGRSP